MSSSPYSGDDFIVVESESNHFDVGNLKGLELAEIYLNKMEKDIDNHLKNLFL